MERKERGKYYWNRLSREGRRLNSNNSFVNYWLFDGCIFKILYIVSVFNARLRQLQGQNESERRAVGIAPDVLGTLLCASSVLRLIIIECWVLNSEQLAIGFVVTVEILSGYHSILKRDFSSFDVYCVWFVSFE